MSEFVPPLTIRPWVFAAKAYGYIPHVMPQLLKGILKALETFDRLLRRTIFDLLVSSRKMCGRDAEQDQNEELQTSSSPQAWKVLGRVFLAEGGGRDDTANGSKSDLEGAANRSL